MRNCNRTQGKTINGPYLTTMSHMQVRTLRAILGIILLITTRLLAQDTKTGTIKGSVIDETTNRPVEFVNVVLHQKVDNAIVT